MALLFTLQLLRQLTPHCMNLPLWMALVASNKLWHITLPSLKATVVLMTTLSLGSILNAGFDQVFNMYNPAVYKTGDIIDTYVYRMGLIDMQYSLATAIGLLKSVVSFVLITISHYLADRFAGYKIF